MPNRGLGQLKGVPELFHESFQEWTLTLKALLMSHELWGIVSGEETGPQPLIELPSEEEEEDIRKGLRDFKARNAKAVSMIYRATPWQHSSHISDLTDPKAMWEKLSDLFDFRKNPLLLFKYRKDFHEEQFSEQDTVRSWSNRLRAHTRKLESSEWPLDPREVVHKLLRELPDEYEMIRQLLYEEGIQKLHFETVVKILRTTNNTHPSQQFERKRKSSPVPEPPAPLKRRCAKTVKMYERKLNKAKDRQARILACDNDAMEEKEEVAGDRIEKILVHEPHCPHCCLPGHTESECPHWERGGGTDSSDAGPATSPAHFYQDMVSESEPQVQLQAQDDQSSPSVAAATDFQTEESPDTLGYGAQPKASDDDDYVYY